jgi:hypothetical protein
MRLGSSARQFENRDAATAFYRPFGDALAAVPGVTMRGAVSSLPFTSSVGWGSINVEGWTPQPGQELQVDQRGATTDYYRTMRIPLIQGRFFTDTDLPAAAQQVAIIDQKFAQRFWPAGDAIGKHVWFDPETPDHHRRRRRCREAVWPRRRRAHGRVTVRGVGGLPCRGRQPIAAVATDFVRKIHSWTRRSRYSASRR